MASQPARKRPTDHDEETIRRALTLVALHHGSPTAAARALEEAGEPISRHTLSRWLRSKPDIYEECRREILPRINEAAAAGCLRVASLAEQAEIATITRYMKGIDQVPPKQLAGDGRNFATIKGINMQRSAEYQGIPQVVEHRPDRATSELWAEFMAMFPTVVQGEAVEIPEAELVAEGESPPGA